MRLLYLLFLCLNLLGSKEQEIFTNAYEYLKNTQGEVIRNFASEESKVQFTGDNLIGIDVINEIVPLEMMFFDSQIEEMSKWPVFKEVEDIKQYLWVMSSMNTDTSYLLEEDIVKNDIKESNLILYFSKPMEHLLVADIFWITDNDDRTAGYDRVSMFGRSLRYLFEVDDNEKILNAVSIEVHHN